MSAIHGGVRGMKHCEMIIMLFRIIPVSPLHDPKHVINYFFIAAQHRAFRSLYKNVHMRLSSGTTKKKRFRIPVMS